MSDASKQLGISIAQVSRLCKRSIDTQLNSKAILVTESIYKKLEADRSQNTNLSKNEVEI